MIGRVVGYDTETVALRNNTQYPYLFQVFTEGLSYIYENKRLSYLTFRDTFLNFLFQNALPGDVWVCRISADRRRLLPWSHAGAHPSFQ